MYKYYPKHAVLMMVVCAVGFGLSIQSIWYKLNADLGSFYLPIITLIISVGFFIMAYMSVKDWYKYFDYKYEVIEKDNK